MVSVVGGGNASCSEDVREHENHDTGGRALARRYFTTVDGVGFSVTAYSEWKNGKKHLVMAPVVHLSTHGLVLTPIRNYVLINYMVLFSMSLFLSLRYCQC